MASTLTAYIPNSKITTASVSGGFIDTTSYLTFIDALGTFTLGSGVIIGQLKKIQSTYTVPGVATVSGQHFLEGLLQEIDFTLAGDTAELMWTRNGWRVISLSSRLGTNATPTIS